MTHPNGAATDERTRLYAYNAGFFRQKRIRRILDLAGCDLRFGRPAPEDGVVVWGASPTAPRGHAVAQRLKVPVVTVEDAFLRSLHPGRAGEPPLGLLIDRAGVHFNADTPCDLEQLLTTEPLDDTALLDRARDAIERIRASHLSKYSAVLSDMPPPDPGYVLVIDQTVGDASVLASGADHDRFREMLVVAQVEHPGAKVLIKTHPETAAGMRPGHFSPEDTSDRVSFHTAPISPWTLLEGAVGVYTVSSQLGFEAIYAGHRPRVFGQPFYAGWGLTDDDRPVPRRERRLTKPQLFAAAMILYPVWYDPYRDRLCALEDVLATLEAQAQAWRADRLGWVASGMRLWKRGPLQQVFGREKTVLFTDDPHKIRASERPWMVWAGKRTPDMHGAMSVEDGFLRSRGLGAELVPPLSLVVDDQGIYYDPTRPSRLETLILAAALGLRTDQRRRSERLIASVTEAGVSKYNLNGDRPVLPDGHRILVPGQVEDDASIQLGTERVSTNLGLLTAARAANPDAVLIYKPHPDVEAGLRDGAIDPSGVADVVASSADPAALLAEVDAVWTMTSLLGFEALLRGVKVTTLGTPFYAGWGLTTDLGKCPVRRGARPDLIELVHAVLIDYPRYYDPVTRGPCPVEVVVERLRDGGLPRLGPVNRGLSKLQGLFATYARLWR